MKRALFLIPLFVLGLLAGIPRVKAQIVVGVRPVPPVYIGVRPPCPGPRHIWIRGHWRWSRYDGRYVWEEGHWTRARRGGVWIDGHWEDVPHEGSRWVPRHWR
ncbi:MAG TPA: hypothetical protein VNZ86_05315 [Bacteroidia bacterium]|jgi:hypothetical protein|nr:hypothetical protein [Bacteroidia bacterium]